MNEKKKFGPIYTGKHFGTTCETVSVCKQNMLILYHDTRGTRGTSATRYTCDTSNIRPVIPYVLHLETLIKLTRSWG